MEFTELINKRRSIRSFSDRAISTDLLQELCDQASTAPMAGDRQNDRKLIPVSDREMLQRMADSVRKSWGLLLAETSEAVREEFGDYAHNFYHFANAPLVVFLVGRRPPEFLKAAVGDQLAERIHGNGASVLMAAQQLILAAENHGLGSCMMTGPLAAEEALKQELSLNGRWILYGVIAMGYPNESR